MIESRCGIECSKCDYKDQMNCLGCVSIEKPFWDQKVGCPIKNCCESKEMENCGYCSNFPCELLKSFAYDKEQGDDGKRIKKCQEWCKG